MGKPKKSGSASKRSRSAKERSSPPAIATTVVKPSAPPTSSAISTAAPATKPSEPSATRKAAELSLDEERFAKMVALGMSQSDAYRKVTGSKAKEETIHEQASRWARKVDARIQELRAAAKEQVAAKYVYEYEDAMKECDEALLFAKLSGDSSAMSKAIALKAKLSGLETEPRQNKRSPFEDMTEEELVSGIEQAMDQAGFTIQ